jgi:hypothetical protein
MQQVAGGKIGEETMHAMRGAIEESAVNRMREPLAVESHSTLPDDGPLPDKPNPLRPGPCGADRICQFFQ